MDDKFADYQPFVKKMKEALKDKDNKLPEDAYWAIII